MTDEEADIADDDGQYVTNIRVSQAMLPSTDAVQPTQRILR
jgi:hypothetical protein